MPSDVLEHVLDVAVEVPLPQRRHVALVNLNRDDYTICQLFAPYMSRLHVDPVDVQLCGETDGRRLLRIVGTALDAKVVDPRLVRSLQNKDFATENSRALCKQAIHKRNSLDSKLRKSVARHSLS